MQTKRGLIFIVVVGFLILILGKVERFTALPNTLDIERFGYRIDYPDGWFASEEGPVSFITEKESELSDRYIQDFKTVGIVVSLDHRPRSFLRTLGLQGDPPTLDDLFALNIGELTGMTNPVIEDSRIFGVAALKSEYYESQWDVSYAGFVGDEAFFLLVTAPDEKTLNDFKPTWNAMLKSIRASSFLGLFPRP